VQGDGIAREASRRDDDDDMRFEMESEAPSIDEFTFDGSASAELSVEQPVAAAEGSPSFVKRRTSVFAGGVDAVISTKDLRAQRGRRGSTLLGSGTSALIGHDSPAESPSMRAQLRHKHSSPTMLALKPATVGLRKTLDAMHVNDGGGNGGTRSPENVFASRENTASLTRRQKSLAIRRVMDDKMRRLSEAASVVPKPRGHLSTKDLDPKMISRYLNQTREMDGLPPLSHSAAQLLQSQTRSRVKL